MFEPSGSRHSFARSRRNEMKYPEFSPAPTKESAKGFFRLGHRLHWRDECIHVALMLHPGTSCNIKQPTRTGNVPEVVTPSAVLCSSSISSCAGRPNDDLSNALRVVAPSSYGREASGRESPRRIIRVLVTGNPHNCISDSPLSSRIAAIPYNILKHSLHLLVG